MSMANMLRAAGAAAQQGARRHRTIGAPLLDYAAATFARASEASAYDARIGAWDGALAAWPGANVPIIYADGAIRIEGARTNAVPDGRAIDAASWSAGTSVVTTPGVADGPDGATLTGDRSQVSSGGFSRFRNVSTTIGTKYAASAFFRSPAGAGTYRVLFGSGTTSGSWSSVEGSTTEAWARAAVVRQATVGTTSLAPAEGRALTGGTGAQAVDCVTDLMQVEEGAFPSSPIRTSGAGATRALDACSFATPPAAILSGHWALSVWPGFAPSEAPATAYLLYLDASNYLAIISGTTIRLRAGGANYDVAGLSYARHAQLTIDVDHGTLMTITGGGGGSVALSNTWAGSTEDLAIGSDGSANHAFAVIGRPVRA